MGKLQDELHDAIQENIHLANYEEQLDRIIDLLIDIKRLIEDNTEIKEE